ncbi:putative N6-adenosine-methyltransferase MT-A70-like [Capsicum annuum]|nr:putative N6-adenosine-methyltransferase MT-A70-like [Capsicum annuum]
MEPHSDGADELTAIKELRQQHETRIQTLRNAQLELIASLQTKIPNIASSLDLSLQTISTITGKPFTPLPTPLPTAPNHNPNLLVAPRVNKRVSELCTTSAGEKEKVVIDECGGPLSVVRAMVAVCLLERVPFTAIDSSTLLRKLENDRLEDAEKVAMRELGGDSGAIMAIEMALKSMAEDNACVELENFVVSGKSRTMVLNIDRTRLLKELPESKQSEGFSGGSRGSQEMVKRGSDSGGVFGMGRAMSEMWEHPHMQGMTAMFPGNMGGPRGGHRGMVGMMGMPRGVGVPPPMPRPPMGLSGPVGGGNSIALKPRTEEDEMKDLENMLNKKSFKEMQKSKTGEELLDLIHRPTAKESAVAARRVPFTAIDSSMLLRNLENDQLEDAEKVALRELGGESRVIMAVEMALKLMTEDNGVTAMFCGNMGGLRGGHRGMPGMVGMPRGVGVPPRMPRLPMGPNGPVVGGNSIALKRRTEEDEMEDLENILNEKSCREMQKSKIGEKLLDLLITPISSTNTPLFLPTFWQFFQEPSPINIQHNNPRFPTNHKIFQFNTAIILHHRFNAISTAIIAPDSPPSSFKSKGGSQVKEYCSALTKEDCRRQSGSYIACDKVHFRRIIAAHTDVNLGDCSFLDTCRHMKTCKYVHYELDSTPDVSPLMMGAATLPPPRPLKPQRAHYCSEVELGEPQWINCDIRSFRMDILGQFGVIMADPPWDIHMELPYGTMADDEMRTLNVPALQTDGLIFLWVTGRAMELGREWLESSFRFQFIKHLLC